MPIQLLNPSSAGVIIDNIYKIPRSIILVVPRLSHEDDWGANLTRPHGEVWERGYYLSFHWCNGDACEECNVSERAG